MGVVDQGMVKVPGLGFGVVESVGFRRLKLLCLRSVRGFGWVWCNSFLLFQDIQHVRAAAMAWSLLSVT